MSLGYIPTDFGVGGDTENFETIFLADEAMIPVEIPEKTVFIFKRDAQFRDFIDLFHLFDESWRGVKANYVLFGVGKSDIMKPAKELILERRVNTLDYHDVPN